jgi:hypothetical protein
MDAFEELAGQLLNADKYWVKHSVKVDLTKDEKVKIHKPTTSRPEIDIAAFDFSTNTIYLLEVKSFLDSPGVVYEHVVQETEIQEGLYKLLTCENYRMVLAERLKKDWITKGFANSATEFSYGLIAGKIHRNREEELEAHFKSKKWLFWGPAILKDKLTKLSGKGYENNAVTIASKLLLR